MNVEDSAAMDLEEQIAIQALDNLKQPFLKRVQNIPLVHRTVNTLSHAYESTKNVSGVLRYSAESVESGIYTISKPVLSSLEPVLRPLDRFASTQLDRVEKNFPSLKPNQLAPLKIKNLRDSSPTVMPTENGSRWPLQKLGDDTIRALQYCLSFLSAAIESIKHHLSILGNAVVSAKNGSVEIMTLKQNQDGSVATVSGNLVVLVASVKRDIAETLRRTVDMLGKYSSSYLPVDAKQSVRSFILSLPRKLAMAKQPTSPLIDHDLSEAQNALDLCNESTKMLTGIKQVIETTKSAASFAIGRPDESRIPFEMKQQRPRYLSNGSEHTLSKDGMDVDTL